MTLRVTSAARQRLVQEELTRILAPRPAVEGGQHRFSDSKLDGQGLQFGLIFLCGSSSIRGGARIRISC